MGLLSSSNANETTTSANVEGSSAGANVAGTFTRSQVNVTDGGAVRRALDSADRAFALGSEQSMATLNAAETLGRASAGFLSESLGFVGDVFGRYADDVGHFADKASATDAERLQTIIRWALIAAVLFAALYLFRSK